MSDTIDLADAPPPSSFKANPDYVPAYVLEPAHWQYGVDQADGVSFTAYPGEIFKGDPTNANNAIATKGDIAASTTGVSSFNTRTGAITLTTADITGAGGAPSQNPTFGGSANYVTQPPGTNSTLLATCQFVTAAIGQVTAASVASFNGRTGSVVLTTGDITTAGGAPLNSPAMTGNPTAPTTATTDASGAVATTQFVANAIASGTVISWNGRKGAVSLTLSDITSAGGAPLASPAFTSVPTAPTAAPGTATTQLATTAFVTNAITAGAAGVASFNTRTGAVTLTTADITGAGGAPIVSPAMTGSPTAPTQTAGTSNTTLATTAFVQNAITGLPGVASFNGRQGAVTLQLADVTSVGGAPLASPNFSGTPTTTTPPPGDNSTRVADTAFVATSYAPLASPAMTGTPTVPTASPGTSTTQAASTAFVGAAVTQATGLVQQAAYDNIGRNLIHNGLMNINQRASGPYTTYFTYSLDRWLIAGGNGDTISVTQQSMTDAERAAIGDEAAQNCMQVVVTGNSAAAAYTEVMQRIEGVRRSSGKTVIVSFFATASTAGLKIGLNAQNYYGTGGSPTAPVNALATGLSVTLATGMARYSAPIPLPSATGAVLGTNNDSSTFIRLGFSSGATNNAFFGNIGVQSGTFRIWGISAEVAQSGVTQPTPLEHLDPQTDLANCQRFYSTGHFMLVGYQVGGYGIYVGVNLPVTMRAPPAANILNNSSTNMSGFQAGSYNATSLYFYGGVTTTGTFQLSGDYVASADL